MTKLYLDHILQEFSISGEVSLEPDLPWFLKFFVTLWNLLKPVSMGYCKTIASAKLCFYFRVNCFHCVGYWIPIKMARKKWKYQCKSTLNISNFEVQNEKFRSLMNVGMCLPTWPLTHSYGNLYKILAYRNNIAEL